jgi:hypothetical protein
MIYRIVVAALLASCALDASVVSTFDVAVDTSQIAGLTGYFDLQFNPGGPDSLPATVTIAEWAMIGGMLSGVADMNGDVNGNLPSIVTLDNSSFFNDVFQPAVFGQSVSFSVEIQGSALDSNSSTSGSTLSLSLYAADAMTPLLTTDPFSSLLRFDIPAGGGLLVETFPRAPGESPAASVSPTSAAPEPAPFSIAGCLLLCILARGTSGSRSRHL